MTSNLPALTGFRKPGRAPGNPSLAASITKAASKQTYYTIRFLVDRDLILDAYRAYGYFRWLDDRLDRSRMERPERLAFVEHQQALINHGYRGEWPTHLTDPETMLMELIRDDREENSGLQSYIRHMMAVMSFDAERRGRLISQDELSGYTHNLAAAVTDALHYFIGHRCKSPQSESRYLAATGAHLTHMLRDTLEDTDAGYFNIPREHVEAHGIDPRDAQSEPYRKWIQSRVELARACFKAGKDYLALVENFRCRLAGYAYLARFENVLAAIERDDYRLRSEYPERRRLGAVMQAGWSVLAQAFHPRRPATVSRAFSIR